MKEKFPTLGTEQKMAEDHETSPEEKIILRMLTHGIEDMEGKQMLAKWLDVEQERVFTEDSIEANIELGIKVSKMYFASGEIKQAIWYLFAGVRYDAFNIGGQLLDDVDDFIDRMFAELQRNEVQFQDKSLLDLLKLDQDCVLAMNEYVGYTA